MILFPGHNVVSFPKKIFGGFSFGIVTTDVTEQLFLSVTVNR